MNWLFSSFIAFLLIPLLIALAACQAPQQAPAGTMSAPPSAPATTQLPSQPAASATPSPSVDSWVADGVISPGEYQNKQVYGDYEINWSNNDQNVCLGIKAKTPGWVAVGFGAESFMNHADIIQGYFSSSNSAIVLDEFSTGNFGPHPDDTTLGGKYNILESGGKQEGGYSVVEFKRKLDTGDAYDRPLVKGANKIIWAYGSDNQFLIKHMNRGEGEIVIQ